MLLWCWLVYILYHDFRFVDNTTVALPVLYVSVLWSHNLSCFYELVIWYRQCLWTPGLFRWCYNHTGSRRLGCCSELVFCVYAYLICCPSMKNVVCIKLFLKLDWLFRFCSLLYDVLHISVLFCVYGRFFFCFKLGIVNYFRSQVKSVIDTCWHGSSKSSQSDLQRFCAYFHVAYWVWTIYQASHLTTPKRLPAQPITHVFGCCVCRRMWFNNCSDNQWGFGDDFISCSKLRGGYHGSRFDCNVEFILLDWFSRVSVTHTKSDMQCYLQ